MLGVTVQGNQDLLNEYNQRKPDRFHSITAFYFRKKLGKQLDWQDEIMTPAFFSKKNTPHHYYAMSKTDKNGVKRP